MKKCFFKHSVYKIRRARTKDVYKATALNRCIVLLTALVRGQFDLENSYLKQISMYVIRENIAFKQDMSELIAHVYGRVSVSHNKSTRANRHARNNDLIFEKAEINRYRGCLLIPQLATEQPSQYYRWLCTKYSIVFRYFIFMNL